MWINPWAPVPVTDTYSSQQTSLWATTKSAEEKALQLRRTCSRYLRIGRADR